MTPLEGTLGILTLLLGIGNGLFQWFQFRGIKGKIGVFEKALTQADSRLEKLLERSFRAADVTRESFLGEVDEWLSDAVVVTPFLGAKMLRSVGPLVLTIAILALLIMLPVGAWPFAIGSLEVDFLDLLLLAAAFFSTYLVYRLALDQTEQEFLKSIDVIYDCFYYGRVIPSMTAVNGARKIFFERFRAAYFNIPEFSLRSSVGNEIDLLWKEVRESMQPPPKDD